MWTRLVRSSERGMAKSLLITSEMSTIDLVVHDSAKLIERAWAGARCSQ